MTSSGIGSTYPYTGTYSYLIAPDDGNGDPIEEPIASSVYAPSPPNDIPTVLSTDVPQFIPPSSTEPPSPGNNVTTSTLTIAGENNYLITTVTVSLSLTAPEPTGNQLIILLTAPNGQQGTVYNGTFFAPGPLNFTIGAPNSTFQVGGLANGRVNGTYTLTIIDENVDNTGGELTAWSVQIDSTKTQLTPQAGDPMDQNADGTPDENPLDPGYNSNLPPLGDIYAAPDPTGLGPFTTAESVFSPPFNQNTLPLIISGPQVLITQADGTSTFTGSVTTGSALITGITSTTGLYAGETVSGTGIPSGTTIETVNSSISITLSSNATVSGSQSLTAMGPVPTSSDNLLTDNTTSQFDVTFDRPVQTSTFDSSQVLSIMGPTGSILAPQTFGSTSIDQEVPAATTAGAGMLPSVLTIDSNGTLTIADITVTLTIATLASDSSLSAVLIAPNGQTITLFNAGTLSGLNLTNTVFSDGAASLATGTAPYTGTFQPKDSASSTLTALQGLIADGTWQLKITNAAGAAATLDSWSLNITPMVTVAPVASTETTVNNVLMATEFAINFPQQEVSGTYTIQLGPEILDQYGDGQDPSSSAGLDMLRGVGETTTTMKYNAVNVPTTIPATTTNSLGQPVPGTVSSSITVPDSFIIEGDQTATGQSVMQVQLKLSFALDPDLTATLSHYAPNPTNPAALGQLIGQPVTLFSNVGSGTNTANFTNTVFDDNAVTPIQNGSAPFSAIYNPQESLATVFAPITGGQNVQGTWILTITNSSTGTTGTINGWSLTFQRPILNTGLGEQGSDDATLSFRISNLGPSDSLSSEVWAPVGPASSTYETGQVNAIAVDPSDASGNTVYVGGASGGIWKTTDFLTTSPNGPTWVPLTNFGPSSAVNISSITIFPVNDNPNDSIIIAATGGVSSGQEGTDAPGVGFLISTNGGVTWNLDDSTDNVSSVNNTTSEIGDTSNILPIDSTARNREFVGTTAYQVTVDPELTPTGQVIIYAALSGPNGGIWESQNTGQTWTQVLAGNASAVILDQNSGLLLDPSAGNPPSNGGNPGSPTYGGNYQIVFAGIMGQGVYMSTNQGQSWTLMAGGIGNPLIVDLTSTPPDKNVNPASNPSPNGGEGKIVLAVPAATNNYVQSELYAGWLYAAVATSSGAFDGLFMTKDFGENWTQVQLDSLPPLGVYHDAVPVQPGYVNAPSGGTPAYPITLGEGNVDLALTVDPQNPNITYLGGFGGDGYESDTGLIRVDATNLQDAHSLVGVFYDQTEENLTLHTNAWTTIDGVLDGTPVWYDTATGEIFPADYLNFVRNPYEPFLANATLYVENVAGFSNTGDGATWTPMDVPTTSEFNAPGEFTGTVTIGSPVVAGISSTTGLEAGDLVTGTGFPAFTYIVSVNSSTSVTLSADSTVGGVEGLNNEISGTGYQILVAEVDPTTGLTRLIAGNLTGIYSGLDDNGTFEANVGTSTALPEVNRNGNLDLAQFYYGAVQPSSAAALVAGSLFYGGAQNIGGQASGPA